MPNVDGAVRLAVAAREAAMNLWYYEDALEAAWMAKHFKMRFGCRYDDGTFNWNPGMSALHRWQEIVRWNEFCGPVFVVPEDHSLLEPRVGDLASDGCHAGLVLSVTDSIVTLSCPRRHNDKEHYCCNRSHTFIIQRNKKAFHWPKWKQAVEADHEQ